MRRRKLHICIMLLAFFAGIVATPAGGQAVRQAASLVREQFDDTCTNNFFPC
jgi:hypothetical protein